MSEPSDGWLWNRWVHISTDQIRKMANDPREKESILAIRRRVLALREAAEAKSYKLGAFPDDPST